MPKDFFKPENSAEISGLKPNAKIHIIGVCGVAMAQLAILLARRGFRVTGSDKEFYEPMAGLLRGSPVKTFLGFKEANLNERPDLVVIGNAISYGNPEVDIVEKENIPYTFFPKLLAEAVIGEKQSIVAAGTHGKSTTSAMLASMLTALGTDPSYFVGAAIPALPFSLHAGNGPYSVVEGDEYDSAFFAKIPKFLFYKPDVLIISSVEYDHADIYPNLDAINAEFSKLAGLLPKSGTLICCIDYPNLKALMNKWRGDAAYRIVTFGEDPEADYCILKAEQKGLSQTVNVECKSRSAFKFNLSIPGLFNAKNGLAALITAEILDLDFEKAARSLSNFQGVKRRQQVRHQDTENILIEDFAHHPTAVKQTIAAIRSAFPAFKLTAVFEPRSATSRRKVFQDDYIKAFLKADRVILSEVRGTGQEKELLDVKSLAADIDAAGAPAVCLKDAAEIRDHLIKTLKPKEAILIMSNGSFDGLAQEVEDFLKSRH